LMAVKKVAEAEPYGFAAMREQTDPRLTAIQRRAAAAGGSEQVPADGGFLVAPQFTQAILRRMYLTGEIFGRCMPMPITDPKTNAVRFPQFFESSRANGSRMGGVFAYWQNEADALVNTKPKFKACELKAEKLTGLLYLTDELATDTAALDVWASYAFSSEILFRLENCILNGTGAGQPLGIVGAPGTLSIAKQTDQTAGTIVPQNIVQMVSQLWSASRRNAVFLYNQQLLPQLMTLALSVGTGGSESRLFHYCSDDSGCDYLAGIPAMPSEYCQVPGTPGDLILADFSRYVLAMRDDSPQAAASIHVKFLTDEVAFRFTFRVNGQPIDEIAITPLNGSTQVSPMVVLAAR
ncbi:MAG: phage major capsid protein, partial [Candidatus Sulfotelmatobacter sp.]